MAEGWIPWVAGALGLALGSFLNVCTLRWPVGESVVRPPSRCPGCGTAISPRDNVPVVGWLLLRGRCRSCREPISIQYPLVELATGVIWAGSIWMWGAEWEALRAAVFFTIVLGIAVSDARFYIIPDQFSIGGAAVGLAFAFAPGGIDPLMALAGAVLGFVGFHLVGVVGTWIVRRRNPDRLEQAFDAHDEQRADPVVQRRIAALSRGGVRAGLVTAAALVTALAGATGGAGAAFAAGAMTMAAVAVLLAWAESFEVATFEPERAARETAAPASALGGGDVRMMLLIGAFLGPAGVALTALGGSVLALLAAVPLSLLFRQLIPLGIFLAYASAFTWLWGADFVAWYLRFAGL